MIEIIIENLTLYDYRHNSQGGVEYRIKSNKDVSKSEFRTKTEVLSCKWLIDVTFWLRQELRVSFSVSVCVAQV